MLLAVPSNNFNKCLVRFTYLPTAVNRFSYARLTQGIKWVSWQPESSEAAGARFVGEVALCCVSDVDCIGNLKRYRYIGCLLQYMFQKNTYTEIVSQKSKNRQEGYRKANHF